MKGIKSRRRQRLFYDFLWVPLIAVLIIWSLTLPLAGTQLLTVRGTVTDDSTGDPVAGATVSADPLTVPVITGKNGSYTIFIKPGTYELKVGAEGFENQTENITVADGDITVNVKLEPSCSPPSTRGATIIGKVSNSKTKVPIAGALVKIDSCRTKTAQDGSYALAVTKGSFTLTVSMEGFKEETILVEVSEDKPYSADVHLVPVPFVEVTASPDPIYTKDEKQATVKAFVKKSDGSPAVGVTVNFKSGDVVTGQDDLGKLESLTVVTDNAGVATVKWTCTVDLANMCSRGTQYFVGFVASTKVEGQPTQGQYTLYVSYARCDYCHNAPTRY